jgi:hypothetical protein
MARARQAPLAAATPTGERPATSVFPRPRQGPVCPPDCRRSTSRHRRRGSPVSPAASDGLPSWRHTSTTRPTDTRAAASDGSRSASHPDSAVPTPAANDSRGLCRGSTAVPWRGCASLPPRLPPRGGRWCSLSRYPHRRCLDAPRPRHDRLGNASVALADAKHARCMVLAEPLDQRGGIAAYDSNRSYNPCSSSSCSCDQRRITATAIHSYYGIYYHPL